MYKGEDMKQFYRIALIILLLTLMSCVYGQSITPVRDNLYCLTAVIDWGRNTNAIMSEMAKGCCPDYKIVARNKTMNAALEWVVIWHITCGEDK